MSSHQFLNNKVVVVTGGGGILCSTIAKELARNRMKVAVLDLNKEAAQKVADEITAEGGSAKAYACNVLEQESVKQAKEAINKDFGLVDILLNGAGGNNPKATTSVDTYSKETVEKEGVQSFFDMSPEGFSFVFNLNFLGTFIPCQVFTPDLLETKGQILNISSMSAAYPLTRVPAYSAAKAAVNNFTMWMAVHFAEAGLRVNAIAPGFFITEQNKTLLKNSDGSLTDRSKKILNHTPLGRFGEPKDLLGPVLYLLDQEASGFITGHIMPIDGGFMAFSGV